jgi:hypothetical protein
MRERTVLGADFARNRRFASGNPRNAFPAGNEKARRKAGPMRTGSGPLSLEMLQRGLADREYVESQL